MGACSISEVDRQRRSLLWQSRTRGWIELDFLLGGFVERKLPTFTNAQAELLQDVLRCQNEELYAWLSGQTPVPSTMLKNEVMVQLLQYINMDHPSLRSEKRYTAPIVESD